MDRPYAPGYRADKPYKLRFRALPVDFGLVEDLEVGGEIRHIPCEPFNELREPAPVLRRIELFFRLDAGEPRGKRPRESPNKVVALVNRRLREI